MTNKLTLCIFTVTHLVVDCACFFVLMGAFSSQIADTQLINLGFLLYNAGAFALQLPLGYLADSRRLSPGKLAIAGCLLVMGGVAVPVSVWIKLTLCALGNALFHVGGGIDSLTLSKGRFSRSGIFISSGALGVGLGSLAGHLGSFSAWWILVALLSCIAALLRFCLRAPDPYRADFDHPPAKLQLVGLVLSLSLIAIIIRAAVGSYTPIPWKSTEGLFLLPAIAVFIGKFVGGLLADRFGARTIAACSLVISAPLLAFANDQVALCCLGLFLFNMVTAVTLCVVVSKIPGYPGFGFGLTTFALFIGSAFSFFIDMPPGMRPVLIVALICLSTLCILLIAPNGNKPNKALSDKAEPESPFEEASS